jgi:hypothetical protein
MWLPLRAEGSKVSQTFFSPLSALHEILVIWYHIYRVCLSVFSVTNFEPAGQLAQYYNRSISTLLSSLAIYSCQPLQTDHSDVAAALYA